ncbi:uncharacterized protein LOC116435254 isoform X2 [Nomia melanderi]
MKNLRHMEQNFHINKELKETQNLRLYERKKINSKQQSDLPKLTSNLCTKKHDRHIVNLSLHNKVNKHSIENQQKLSKKSSMPEINKNNDNIKKTLHSTISNNSPMKQKGKECRNPHKFVGRLHENVSSDPVLLCESTKDVGNDKNTKTKFKNKGIQTLDADQMDNLYSEGMIRYPSKKYLNNNESNKETEINEENDNILKSAINTSSNQDHSENSELHPPKEQLNFSKLNKDCTFENNKTIDRINNNNNNKNNNNNNNSNYNKKNAPPSNYRKGVVPKYIKAKKEAQIREEKAKAEASDPDCPSGHVSLPEHERKETLNILKKNYQDYVNELNMMPIKSDTLRSQQRKAEIEKQLNKLEEGIKVFSKPKVYVKMNA